MTPYLPMHLKYFIINQTHKGEKSQVQGSTCRKSLSVYKRYCGPQTTYL